MDETSIVYTNATVIEIWDLFGSIVLLLQAKSHKSYVCGKATYVFGVGDPADCHIVFSASVPIVDLDGFWTQNTHFFKAIDEFTGNRTVSAVMTLELTR